MKWWWGPLGIRLTRLVGILFRSELFFLTARELEYFFFFLHQNQNIFFSNIENQNIFLEKKS